MKENADRLAQKMEQQNTGDGDADSAFEDMTAKDVDEISQHLRGNESDSKAPSPRAPAKPTDSGEGQRCGEQRKTDARDFPERRQFLMGAGIQRPDAIQRGT